MMERSTTDRTLLGRMIGAARMNVDTYEDVERDVDATSQAAIVVLIAAIATGIGRLRDDNIGGLIFGVISVFVGWIVWSFVMYWVGKTIFKTENTRVTPGEMLRTLGFAHTPDVLNVLGLIPGVGVIAIVVAWVWKLVLSIVAVRQALDFSTGRAIGTALVSAIPALIISGLILAIPRAIF